MIEFEQPTRSSSIAPRDREAAETFHTINQYGHSKVLEGIDRTGHLLSKALETPRPVVSIIVPAFNEIQTIESVIGRLIQLPVDKQIIIVDDGSTDGTRDIIQGFSTHARVEVSLHSKNLGKGAAIQTGISRARGEIVIVQDADSEYDPSDILTVIEPIRQNQSEVVYGSRYMNGSKQDGSLIHRLGNRILTGLSNLTCGHRLTDMETCYKAFRRELIQSIHIEQTRFGFEPEITAKLARRKVSIIEVPIRYSPRSWSEGKKIGWKDLFNTLWCIVRYRFFG